MNVEDKYSLLPYALLQLFHSWVEPNLYNAKYPFFYDEEKNKIISYILDYLFNYHILSMHAYLNMCLYECAQSLLAIRIVAITNKQVIASVPLFHSQMDTKKYIMS